MLVSKATKRTPSPQIIITSVISISKLDYLNTGPSTALCPVAEKHNLSPPHQPLFKGLRKWHSYIYDNANFLKVSANKFTGRYKLFCITISLLWQLWTLIVNFGVLPLWEATLLCTNACPGSSQNPTFSYRFLPLKLLQHKIYKRIVTRLSEHFFNLRLVPLQRLHFMDHLWKYFCLQSDQSHEFRSFTMLPQLTEDNPS